MLFKIPRRILISTRSTRARLNSRRNRAIPSIGFWIKETTVASRTLKMIDQSVDLSGGCGLLIPSFTSKSIEIVGWWPPFFTLDPQTSLSFQKRLSEFIRHYLHRRTQIQTRIRGISWDLDMVVTACKLFVQKPAFLTAIADCNAAFFGFLYQSGAI